MGLVNAVVPDEELDAEVNRWCSRSCAAPPGPAPRQDRPERRHRPALLGGPARARAGGAQPRLRPRAPGGDRELPGEAARRLAQVPRRPGPGARLMPDAGARALRPAIRDAVEAALAGAAPLRRPGADARRRPRRRAPGPVGGRRPPARPGRPAGVVTYSRKVFIPLTNLCRDICSYCTFARKPRRPARPHHEPDEVLAVAEAGRRLGCKEALFTLGDRPEARFEGHRRELRALRPRLHPVLPGGDVPDGARADRPAAPPQRGDPRPARAGRAARGLGEPGDDAGVGLRAAVRARRPHEHAPDKRPATRLAMIRRAGRAAASRSPPGS